MDVVIASDRYHPLSPRPSTPFPQRIHNSPIRGDNIKQELVSPSSPNAENGPGKSPEYEAPTPLPGDVIRGDYTSPIKQEAVTPSPKSQPFPQNNPQTNPSNQKPLEEAKKSSRVQVWIAGMEPWKPRIPVWTPGQEPRNFKKF